jgi:hypothetical protein
MGQELGPQEKSDSTPEDRHGRRHAGAVDTGVIHRHTPPCLPATGTGGMRRYRVALRGECRDTGLACQQDFCLSSQPCSSHAVGSG